MKTLITLTIGIIIIFLGIVTLINPNFSRWINIPGEAHLKAIVSIVIGTILIIISFII